MSEDRLTRKDIKRDIREDEVGTFLQTVVEGAYERRSLIAKIGAALLVLAIAIVAAGAYRESRLKAVSEDLVEAMKIYSAPVEGEDEADNPLASAASSDTPTFANVEERRISAREKLEAVRGQSGGGAAKDVAGLLLADLAAEEGDLETARTLWQAFVDKHGDHMLAQSARLNLISLDRDQGKSEAVVERLQGELAKSNKPMPEDVILYELGRTLEMLDRDEEAKTYFQRIVDEHASSPYVADARQRTSEANAVNPGAIAPGALSANG